MTQEPRIKEITPVGGEEISAVKRRILVGNEWWHELCKKMRMSSM